MYPHSLAISKHIKIALSIRVRLGEEGEDAVEVEEECKKKEEE